MRSKRTGWQTLGDAASSGALRGTVVPGSIPAGGERTSAPVGWQSLGAELGSGRLGDDLSNDSKDLPQCGCATEEDDLVVRSLDDHLAARTLPPLLNITLPKEPYGLLDNVSPRGAYNPHKDGPRMRMRDPRWTYDKGAQGDSSSWNGIPMFPPGPPPGMSSFVDPCKGMLSGLDYWENEKKTLQNDLKGAPTNQKAGLAAQIQAAKAQITQIHKKYASCCLAQGGKPGLVISIPISVEIFIVYFDQNGLMIFEFSLQSDNEDAGNLVVIFHPFWHEVVSLSVPLFAHTADAMSAAALAEPGSGNFYKMAYIKGGGKFDPISGLMALTIAADIYDWHDPADPGVDHDQVIFDLSTDYTGDALTAALTAQDSSLNPSRVKLRMPPADHAWDATLAGPVSVSGNGRLSKLSLLPAIAHGSFHTVSAALRISFSEPSPFLTPT